MLPPQMRNADAHDARARQPERAATRSPATTIRTRIARRGSPASTWSPTCARSTTPRTATTSRSTRSIRAACPASSSTSTRASACRPISKYLNSTMDTLRMLAEQHRRPRDRQPQRPRDRHEADHARLERLLPARLQLVAGADRRQVPRDQGAREAARRAGARAQGLLGAHASRMRRARWRRRSRRPPKPVEAALAAAVARPSRASVVRTWIGTSRGENGKTRVTFVWEPLPKAPGDRAARGAGARVADGGRARRLAVLPRQGAGRRRSVGGTGGGAGRRRRGTAAPAAAPRRRRSASPSTRSPARCSCGCRSKAPLRRCSTPRRARSPFPI